MTHADPPRAATDDGLPAGTLSYSWGKINGPGTVTFAGTSTSDTIATFSAAGVYTLRLTVNDSKLSSTDDMTITVNPSPYPTPTPTPTPTATPSPTPIRINCGGPAYTDSLGQAWSADMDFVGGRKNVYTPTVTGTSDPTLYQSERSGTTVTYQIPVANGNYQATLDFAENYWNAAGKRVFNVTIEGQTVPQNFDIWALVGKNAALQETFVITVSDGMLNIDGAASVDQAKFSATQVVPQ